MVCEHGVAIHDATFTIQETIRWYVQERDTVHQLLNELDKTFDSVEFPAIFTLADRCRIKGKS